MAWGCSLRYRLLFGNHVSDMVLYGYLRAFCCRSRVMFLVTRVLDAITDPLTGIVADRVKTRWGHFRPWLIWFAVPYAVLAVMTFTTPEFGASGKLVYAYLTYTLLMLCYTFINIPYCALGGVITRDEKDRLSAQSYRFTISSLAGLMVSVATLFTVDFSVKKISSLVFRRQWESWARSLL